MVRGRGNIWWGVFDGGAMMKSMTLLLFPILLAGCASADGKIGELKERIGKLTKVDLSCAKNMDCQFISAVTDVCNNYDDWVVSKKTKYYSEIQRLVDQLIKKKKDEEMKHSESCSADEVEPAGSPVCKNGTCVWKAP